MGTLLVLLLQILYIYMHHSRFCLYQIYMYLSVSDSESLLDIPYRNTFFILHTPYTRQLSLCLSLSADLHTACENTARENTGRTGTTL